MVPSAAARTGFEGMSPTIQSLNGGSSTRVVEVVSLRAANASGSNDARDRSGGAKTAAIAALKATKATKITNVRPPILAALPADVDARPVTRSETTSGMTVIRIAFTHSVPIGSIQATPTNKASAWFQEMNTPTARPTTRATRIRLVSDINYGQCSWSLNLRLRVGGRQLRNVPPDSRQQTER